MRESCQDVTFPQTSKRPRNPKRGFTLLASLVAIMALASLTTLIQIRAVSNQRLAARLTADFSTRLAEDALHERLRGLVADQMVAESPRQDRPAFNGTPFAMEQNGRSWMVAVQDLEGLVDLYMAPPEILRRILPNAAQVLAVREPYLSAENRMPRLEMTIARFGLPVGMQGWLTQGKISAGTIGRNAPDALIRILNGLQGGSLNTEQVTTIRINYQQRASTSTTKSHQLFKR